MPLQPRPLVLAVDDDPWIRKLIEQVGRGAGFAVQTSASVGEFLEAFGAAVSPSLLVVDLRIGDGDGVEVLRGLADAGCQTPIVLLSAFDARIQGATRRIGEDLGLEVVALLHKPIPPEALEEALRRYVAPRARITDEELEAAVKERELFLEFQPIVALPERRLAGAEGLIRWNHPRLGVLAPDAFLPLFDEAGLGHRVLEAGLEIGCRQIRRWRDRANPLCLSLNVSPRVLQDPKLPDKLLALIRGHGISSADLIVEITEEAAMTDVVSAAESLARFRIHGFELALDDFGTGFSSLVWLHRLPFSQLKIDRCFVTDLLEDEEAEIIVRSTLDLARNLGLKTCAEGVESEACLERLATLGCDRAQGYWIGRPTSGERCGEWRREREER